MQILRRAGTAESGWSRMRDIWSWLRFALAVLIGAAALITVIVLLSRGPDAAQPEPGGQPAPGSPSGPGVIAVKVDNVAAARPQTGLGAADVVYVEPIEGGFTRFVAVYSQTPPEVVGPVRSARLTDVELLAQYGKPTLAFSGAAPETVPALRDAGLVNGSAQNAESAYFRDPGRPGPHDLYVRPDALPRPEAGPAGQPWVRGDSPDGDEIGERRVVVGNTGYDFVWSAEAARWLVSVDGKPLPDTTSGPLGAGTVIEQRVPASYGESPEDAAGNRAPVVHTVGSGPATMLREGKRIDVTWERPGPADPTIFRNSDGDEVPVADGPVWVLLVPA